MFFAFLIAAWSKSKLLTRFVRKDWSYSSICFAAVINISSLLSRYVLTSVLNVRTSSSAACMFSSIDSSFSLASALHISTSFSNASNSFTRSPYSVLSRYVSMDFNSGIYSKKHGFWCSSTAQTPHTTESWDWQRNSTYFSGCLVHRIVHGLCLDSSWETTCFRGICDLFNRTWFLHGLGFVCDL